MTAVYKREVRAYFQSMTGPVFIAFLLAFTGIYFVAYNLSAGYPYFSYTLSGSLIVFLVGIPLITMRSFSENKGCLSLYRTSSPENRSLETLFMRFCQSSCRAETPVPVFQALHTEQGRASQHLFDICATDQ